MQSMREVPSAYWIDKKDKIRGNSTESLEGILKDAASLEIYFVFACVWGFGGAMSITSGTDYRRKFSQYWKDTWKTIKFPHRGEVFDVFVDKAKKDFVSWDSMFEMPLDAATARHHCLF